MCLPAIFEARVAVVIKAGRIGPARLAVALHAVAQRAELGALEARELVRVFMAARRSPA